MSSYSWKQSFLELIEKYFHFFKSSQVGAALYGETLTIHITIQQPFLLFIFKIAHTDGFVLSQNVFLSVVAAQCP